jgi:hypothetical protein
MKKDYFPNAPGLSKHLNLEENNTNKTKRYFFPFTQKYYSMCSKHMSLRTKDCHMCRVGSWNSVVKMWFDAKIFEHFPRLWFFLKNNHMSFKKRIKESIAFKTFKKEVQ